MCMKAAQLSPLPGEINVYLWEWCGTWPSYVYGQPKGMGTRSFFFLCILDAFSEAKTQPITRRLLLTLRLH